ncbi:purple acid phosphatase 22-like isoform X2 [Humulus lupulus]|uniref:purple acid phosphatase 22-like isoform X2 n=1 Tax=Humulus lupulus TaxID=3486 RepID=UPI002B4160B1|nr:purple acid phosphatase 22-like isoform X2 [Humulus lupulus]
MGKMNQLRVIFYTIFLANFFLCPQILEAKHDDFHRFPPGKMVFPPNKRSDSDPQQVHISLVGKDHMRVSWSTTEHKHTKTVVEYGITPNEYNATATGEYTSYRYFFYSSGKIHHVTIGPLEPATTYYYRCGGSGPEFSFRTPPAAFPLQFVVVGDLGQTEWTSSTLKHVESKDYDVLLLPGDLSYADTQQPLWDSFGRLVEPYASRRPWMVTQGNHEVETIPIIFSEPFKAYNARWPMPYQQSGSISNLYYSFEVAGAHVIMLGSYTDFDTDSDQFRWLAADLAGLDREKTPWVFVLVHAPWYNTNLAHQGEGESMRKALEELLYKARVDVVFAGHVHAYERFTRIYNKEAESCGPMYVTIGDGGNREGLALTFQNPPSPLSLFRQSSFGHGRLNVVNETHAHWSWHRNNDLNSVEADHLWFQSLSTTKNCWDQSSEPPSTSSSSINHHDEL